jgi:hypothetical protein
MARTIGSKGSGEGSGAASVDFYHLTLTFLFSFLAWPLLYFLNNGFKFIDETVRPFWMSLTGFVMLIVMLYLIKRLTSVTDWVYYGVTLFAFTCMIDLIISLEFNGVIANFMSEYLKFGEPYLHCPWGNAIALFDGTGFYFMYLALAFLLANGKSWRSLGLYWSAGILNSMVVLLFGVAAGKHDPTFCTFLNVPYVFFPIAVFVRALTKESRGEWTKTIKSGAGVKALDVLVALGFIASIWLCLVKGVGAVGNTKGIVLQLLKHEAVLFYDDPAPFAAIQVLVYLFYLVPVQVLSLVYAFKSVKPQYLWEVTLINAGIVMQSQFSYICTALDTQTPEPFRSHWDDMTFWIVNATILAVPHLFLYRLSLHRRTSKQQKNR